MMYRREPEIVEARQFDGSETCAVELLKWCLREGWNVRPPAVRCGVTHVMSFDPLTGVLAVRLVEGRLELWPGEWLVKNDVGVFTAMIDSEFQVSHTLMVEEAA